MTKSDDRVEREGCMVYIPRCAALLQAGGNILSHKTEDESFIRRLQLLHGADAAGH